jgi:hypothetical protein
VAEVIPIVIRLCNLCDSHEIVSSGKIMAEIGSRPRLRRIPGMQNCMTIFDDTVKALGYKLAMVDDGRRCCPGEV